MAVALDGLRDAFVVADLSQAAERLLERLALLGLNSDHGTPGRKTAAVRLPDSAGPVARPDPTPPGFILRSAPLRHGSRRGLQPGFWLRGVLREMPRCQRAGRCSPGRAGARGSASSG